MDILAKKIEKIISEIGSVKEKAVQSLYPVKVKECGYKSDNTLPKVDDTWSDYQSDIRLGGQDKHYWIYASFKTPKCDENCELRLNLSTGIHPLSWEITSINPQCILYVNGEMVQGLDINHLEYDLKSETDYEVYIYLYTGMLGGYLYNLNISIASVNKIYEELYYDIKVPFDAAKLFDDDDFVHIETIKHLNIAVMKLDMRSGDSPEFKKSAIEAITYLKENYYGQYPAFDITVDAIGHTHIDVAWMWTYAQTKEKVQRSFSIVLRLMEKYPEYIFTISQPQLLQYLKEETPEIYAQIKELVQIGRIEIEGAMWLEPDCNLSSGESLVRQLIKGKRFIKDEFGNDSKILWLPDVFGYSAALPQILKKAGVDKFVTSKISWNEYNKLPYDIFNWRGIDGSEILTYFIVSHRHTSKSFGTSYCAEIDPDYVLGTWERFQQKEYSNKTFIVYGYGDGGGGPTPDMLEQRRRIDAGIIGIPKCPPSTLKDSLDRIERKFYKNAKALKRLPKWVGELYLEFHRGTYTSIGKIKWYNRKCEFLCGNTEKLSVMNMLINKSEYPKAILDEAWHTVLLNQFHDVVPGSSIHKVYNEESFPMYEKAIKELNEVNSSSCNDLADKIAAEGKLIVFNTNVFEAEDHIECDGEYISTGIIPSMGYKVIDKKSEECQVKVGKKTLENRYYKVIFDDNMDIISIYDKEADREVIKNGCKANEFRFYEDLPYDYDAWELSEYHKDKMWLAEKTVSVMPIYEGARAGFEVVKRFKDSTITQKIYLYNNSKRIDFKTNLDWHQRHLIFKTAFPVSVNADKAVYDIQFGNLERTHNINTSWDVAKFETCAHKWVDISDNGYGMALLNDCKYGYSVVDDSTLQLTLIQGSNSSADFLASGTEVNDQGIHEFTYSIIPHNGDFREGNIVKEGYILNNPMHVIDGKSGTGELPTEYSMISADCENMVIETIKKAEESNNIIIRMYEAYNRSGKVKVKFGFDVKKLYLCDLLENVESEVAVADGIAKINYKNYEIITLKAEV